MNIITQAHAQNEQNQGFINMDILDKRRKEGWRITLWCERGSVACQITTPEQGGGDENKSPDVDVLCWDFSTAVKFARMVCRRTPREVERTSSLVSDWRISPRDFLKLLDTNHLTERETV